MENIIQIHKNENDSSNEKKKFYSFEEATYIEKSDYFLLTSRYMRYYMIIHAHPITKVSYYTLIFCPITVFFASCDIIAMSLKLVIIIAKFGAINIWEGSKWMFIHLWDLVGEAVLAFLKRMLGVLGVFVAGYAIYVFFKSGAYINVYDLILKIFVK